MQKHRIAWGAFVAFGILHLTALYWDLELLRRLSKLVLIPLLLLVYISSSNAKPKTTVVFALIFSFLGDVLLLGTISAFFLSGIAVFLVTQLLYSYTLVKSIAEEIRGLAMEFNCAIVTSSQFNRDGYGNSDVDLTNTSESMGITHTADCILGLISSEELDNLGQLMIKQLKNRWGDLGYYRRFVVGIDRSKMQIYDLEPGAQQTISRDTAQAANSSPRSVLDLKQDDGPVFDKGAFGSSKKKGLFAAGELS